MFIRPCSPSWRFQFTLPRGERLDISEVIATAQGVSIHAPARGATQSESEGHSNDI